MARIIGLFCLLSLPIQRTKESIRLAQTLDFLSKVL